MENVRSGNYCFSAISYKMKTRSWRHRAFSWHLLQARFNYVLQATFNNNYNCLPLCKASFCLGDENSRKMPTELAQIPFNVSSCLCVRAFSRCWWCAYCVPGLCQVLQVAACAWTMVPLLQKIINERGPVLPIMHGFICAANIPCLSSPCWSQCWGSRNELRASPAGSLCSQELESRSPAWLADATALPWLEHSQA